MSLRQAHEVAHDVESALRESFPNAEILIHQEPSEGDADGESQAARGFRRMPDGTA